MKISSTPKLGTLDQEMALTTGKLCRTLLKEDIEIEMKRSRRKPKLLSMGSMLRNGKDG